MFRYEVLFVTVPEITKDESEAVRSHFSKIIRAHKGSMLSFDRWGKYRLAYQVKKNEYGVYFLTRFEVDLDQKESLLAAIKDVFVFKFNSLIPKHIIERLDPKASLAYRRPDSLEDNPQDVDTFLKRNEMEGLIKNTSKKNFTPKEKFASKEIVDEVEDIEDIE